MRVISFNKYDSFYYHTTYINAMLGGDYEKFAC